MKKTILFLISFLLFIFVLFATGIFDTEEDIEKTEGYNLDDCLKVCENSYDISIKVSICQTNCQMYGKPSESMDRYVNSIKEINNES